MLLLEISILICFFVFISVFCYFLFPFLSIFSVKTKTFTSVSKVMHGLFLFFHFPGIQLLAS